MTWMFRSFSIAAYMASTSRHFPSGVHCCREVAFKDAISRVAFKDQLDGDFVFDRPKGPQQHPDAAPPDPTVGTVLGPKNT